MYGCDAIYAGKTTRHFGVRRGEHIGSSVKTNKNTKPDAHSAINMHFISTGHKPNKNDFRIIDFGQNNYTTRIKEAIRIV